MVDCDSKEDTVLEVERLKPHNHGIPEAYLDDSASADYADRMVERIQEPPLRIEASVTWASVNVPNYIGPYFRIVLLSQAILSEMLGGAGLEFCPGLSEILQSETPPYYVSDTVDVPPPPVPTISVMNITAIPATSLQTTAITTTMVTLATSSQMPTGTSITVTAHGLDPSRLFKTTS